VVYGPHRAFATVLIIDGTSVYKKLINILLY